MKPTKLELVSWVDSRQSEGSWRFIEDVPEPCVVVCQTVGWVVRESDVAIMIAQSIGDCDSDSDEYQCAGIKQIPNCCITSREVLRDK
jgi:hypothetical protein